VASFLSYQGHPKPNKSVCSMNHAVFETTTLPDLSSIMIWPCIPAQVRYLPGILVFVCVSPLLCLCACYADNQISLNPSVNPWCPCRVRTYTQTHVVLLARLQTLLRIFGYYLRFRLEFLWFGEGGTFWKLMIHTREID
jgi:hypothetical protein